MEQRFEAPRRILVATDFSEPARAALAAAAALAERTGAELALVHVLPDVRRALIDAAGSAKVAKGADDVEELGRAMRQRSDARLDELLGPLRDRGIRVRRMTLLGVPYVSLVELALAEQFDLVATATRGLSIAKRFLVGSTAERLVRECPVPVWTIRSDAPEIPKRILAPVDFSEVSAKALGQAAWLAGCWGAELLVLHVRESRSPEGLADDASAPRIKSESKSKTVSKLEEFVRANVPEERPCQQQVAAGVAWKTIESVAKKAGVDLIVLGSVARTGIPGFVIGNTAEKVLRSCAVSLWTVKPDGFHSPILPAFWKLYPDAPEPTSEPPGVVSSSEEDGG